MRKLQAPRCNCSVYLVTSGYVTRGSGRAAYFVKLGVYQGLVQSLLLCNPYPGTLNVELEQNTHVDALKIAMEEWGPCLVFAPRDKRLGRVAVLEALVYGVIPALIVVPEKGVHDYPRILEIVACRRLNELAGRLGGRVYLAIGCNLIKCLYSWSISILRLASLSL